MVTNSVSVGPNSNNTRRWQRNRLDIRSSELNTSDRNFNKGLEGRNLRGKPDDDYSAFLSYYSMEEVTVDEDDENEDEADKDPQYVMFLKELRENDKSYKLKLVSSDGIPHFLEYHKEAHINSMSFPDDMGHFQIHQQMESFTNLRSLHDKEKKISMKNGSLEQNKKQMPVIESQHSTAADSCYQRLLDGYIKSSYYSFEYGGKLVNYEDLATCSYSEVVVLNDDQSCRAANDIQLVTAKEDPSSVLKKELMCILNQPYDHKEHKELMEYVEEQRLVCHHKDLRGRPVSFPVDGSTKSVLDDYRGFGKRLHAAQNDRAKSLNLLRGFCYWLKHLPNEGAFRPWLDKECLKVRPQLLLR